MEYVSYAVLFIGAWFVLGVVLRRARIWQRQCMLRRLQRDFGNIFTEREVFGDELTPHI